MAIRSASALRVIPPDRCGSRSNMAGSCPFRPGQTARTQSIALPEGLSQKVADVNQPGQKPAQHGSGGGSE